MDIMLIVEAALCFGAPLVLALMCGIIWWDSRKEPGDLTFYPIDPFSPVLFILDDLEDEDER